MTLKIEINMDNAAFGDSPGAETARILREVADQMEGCVYETGAFRSVLADFNGNRVGEAKVTR